MSKEAKSNYCSLLDTINIVLVILTVLIILIFTTNRYYDGASVENVVAILGAIFAPTGTLIAGVLGSKSGQKAGEAQAQSRVDSLKLQISVINQKTEKLKSYINRPSAQAAPIGKEGGDANKLTKINEDISEIQATIDASLKA